MNDHITVLCHDDNLQHQVALGTPLTELAVQCAGATERRWPVLAAYVDNRIKELHYRVCKPVTVRFIDISSSEGQRVCERTAIFMLQKAVRELCPEHRLIVRHSLGSGVYFELKGSDPTDPTDPTALAESLCSRMRAIAEADYPIVRRRLPTDEVREIYRRRGFDDKIALLDTRPRLYSDICSMDDEQGYFYGALAPSTGCIRMFDIKPYLRGFYLMLPDPSDPTSFRSNIRADKMSHIFSGYKQWVDIMGVPTVGLLNAKVLAGEASDLVKIAEALHEKRLAAIADMIYEANRERNLHMVLISGPSSSGKTTFAKRLGIQLRILGLNPVQISLDDYFVDRDKTPLDENGDYDYEALEAINLPLFNEHLQRLGRGESVAIPRYDFVSGRSMLDCTPLTLDERSILVIEGIHGLNPRLTPGIAEDKKFKIYISCFTTVAMDNVSRIHTTDNRLLRRMIRDSRTRGSDAVSTLSRWASVRRGEERHIFPYQENADVMFNSSMFYELAVLRPFAEPLLREVPDTEPVYAQARQMLKFLDSFTPIDAAEVPPTSLLREFIGGSSFK